MSEPSKLTFSNVDSASRYEVRLYDQLAGLIDYQLTDRIMIITHTETNPGFRGQGIAEQLTRFALNDVRARGLRIVPQCPYTAQFVAEHEEYADLAAG